MKVSSYRNLLLVLDLALAAGISSVVYRGIQEKKARPVQQKRLIDTVEAELSDVAAGGEVTPPRADYGENISGVNISGYAPVVPKVVAPTVTTPVAATKPPLDTVLKVIGIERHESKVSRSKVMVAREGAFPGKPEDALREPRYFEEGSVVEWAHGAIVKLVESDRVTFDYDGKDVVILPKSPPPTAGAKPVRKTEVAPNTDVATWVTVDPQRPGNVEITDVGVASIREQGDLSLEGVRWSSESLDDGQPAIRLDEVPPNSVLARGGAQGGDVLISLNGARVSSKADIVSYVKRNPDLSRYEVVFLRKGVKHTRVVSVPRR